MINTYCYSHGLVFGGCTTCGPHSFPDIPTMEAEEREQESMGVRVARAVEDSVIVAARNAIYKRQPSLTGKITKSSVRDALVAALTEMGH